MAVAKPEVLVFGHSFVGRLAIFTYHDSLQDISPTEYEIRRTDTNISLHRHLQHNSRIILWRHKMIFESPLKPGRTPYE